MTESRYVKNFVSRPLYEISGGKLTGRQFPTMTLMNNKLVPGSNMYLEVGWVWEMPEPNPHIFEHSHDKYDEIVLHIGSDPDNPDDLGAEIEFSVGDDPFVIDKTSAFFLPAGLKHGPVVWKKVSRPHLQMSLVLGAGSLAEARPGGHDK